MKAIGGGVNEETNTEGFCKYLTLIKSTVFLLHEHASKAKQTKTAGGSGIGSYVQQ